MEATGVKQSAREHAADKHEEMVDKQPNQGTTGIFIAEVATQEWRGSYGEKNEEKYPGKELAAEKKFVEIGEEGE